MVAEQIKGTRAEELIDEAIHEWGGEAPVQDIVNRAAQEGISLRTLTRAKRRLGVVSERREGVAEAGYWVWRYPAN